VVEYRIRVTDYSAKWALDALKRDMPRIERKLLARESDGVVGHTQANYLAGQVLKRQSGTLANSLHWRFTGAFKTTVGPGVIYGAAHEFGIPREAGIYIYPKRAKALSFVWGGDRVFFRRVRMHVPKRPWLEPSMRDFFREGGKAERIAERTFEEEIGRRFN